MSDQSIRLHKSSSSQSSFSWKEGIAMRSLDKNYVTPCLRKNNLLKLNADGFMMTRSLAENYPYSALYKANLRGARSEWLAVIDEIEMGHADPFHSLVYLLSLLLNSNAEFHDLTQKTLQLVKDKIEKFSSCKFVSKFLIEHIERSDYAARLLEISLHSLLQAVTESGSFGMQELKPLSHMRSANKKHGNIGDIELLEDGKIIEAWDAKYGKAYLREEVEEIYEKVHDHDHLCIAGFVTNVPISGEAELTSRIKDLSEIHGLQIHIMEFSEWVSSMYERCLDDGFITKEELSRNWILAYAESLSQKKREIAPIDEPSKNWVNSLYEQLTII